MPLGLILLCLINVHPLLVFLNTPLPHPVSRPQRLCPFQLSSELPPLLHVRPAKVPKLQVDNLGAQKQRKGRCCDDVELLWLAFVLSRMVTVPVLLRSPYSSC